MVPGPVVGMILTFAVVAGGNSDEADCAKESVRYGAAVASVTEALRAFEKCIIASHGRDTCTPEFDDLDAAQAQFESAVADHERLCQLPKESGTK